MYRSEQRGPKGDQLWIYEIEFNEEEEIYEIEDIDWTKIEYSKFGQFFTGKSALDIKLEDQNWNYEGEKEDNRIYRHRKGWQIQISDDSVHIDLEGTKLSKINSYELEAWVHCKESESIEELVEAELS